MSGQQMTNSDNANCRQDHGCGHAERPDSPLLRGLHNNGAQHDHIRTPGSSVPGILPPAKYLVRAPYRQGTPAAVQRHQGAAGGLYRRSCLGSCQSHAAGKSALDMGCLQCHVVAVVCLCMSHRCTCGAVQWCAIAYVFRHGMTGAQASVAHVATCWRWGKNVAACAKLMNPHIMFSLK